MVSTPGQVENGGVLLLGGGNFVLLDVVVNGLLYYLQWRLVLDTPLENNPLSSTVVL